MQGSNLTITVKAVGVPQAEAQLNKLGATMTRMTVNQNGTVSATGRVAGALDNQRKSTDAVAGATNRASKAQEGYFGHIARTTIQSALINKLFLELVDVSGQAIKQVDLMNNFPATMASMGQSTDAASQSMQALRDYVGQIGGNLGDATSYVTRFVDATGDVRAATAVFVGMNNALIAGSSSAEEQRLAMIQFAQALERGRPDLREWRSLTQNMSFQLQQVARSMGYVNANELGEALTHGEESMAAFTTALTKMATGTGPIAQQAMAQMQGMQFAFNVMKNTLVQGLAAIIDAIGRQNIVSFFTFLTQVIQVLAQGVVVLIGWIVTLLNLLGSLFGLPEIKLKKDTGGIADNIGSGADSAEDLAEGLGDAGKGAKELNKELKRNLASFDKMNVLAEDTPTSGRGGSGGKDDDGAGGSPFDAGQIGELGDIFDNLGGGLQDASKWAKIFAGILAALAANKLIEKIFGVNPIKAFGRAVYKHAIRPLGVYLVTAAKTGVQAIGTFGAALGRGLLGKGSGGSGVLGEAAALGARIGLAVRGGFVGVFARIAAAIGVSLGVAAGIVAGIVVAIIAAVWLIWTNWDTIVGFMKTAWSGLLDFFDPTIQFFKDLFEATKYVVLEIWNAMFGALKGQLENLKKEWNKLSGAWDELTKSISEVWNSVTEELGKAWDKFYEKIEPGVTAVKNLFAAMEEKVSPLIDTINKKLGEIRESVQPLIDKVKEFYKDNIQPMINKIKEWVTQSESLKTVLNVLGIILVALIFAPIALIIAAILLVVGVFISLGIAILWVITKLIEFGTKAVNSFKKAWNGIKEAWGKVTQFFKNIWSGIKDAFGKVGSWFRNTFKDAWEGVKKVFSTGGKIFSGIKEGISKVFKTVVNGIIGGINTVVKTPFDAINGALNRLKNLSIARQKPFEWLPTIPVPQIPKLATGGVVDQATLAVLGEDGSEAVMPLENNTEWIDKLAAKINTNNRTGPDNNHIPSRLDQPQQAPNITIEVSGVFATSTAEQRKLADIIAKRVKESLKTKTVGAF